MPNIQLFEGSLAQYLGDGVFSVSQDGERGPETVVIDVEGLRRLLHAFDGADLEA